MAKQKDISKNKVIILILIVASGTLLANTYINKINLQKSNLVDVTIAKTDIEDGMIITDQMVTIAKISQEQVLTDINSTASEVIGKTAIVPIYKNEQISKRRITETIDDPDKNNWVMKIDPLDKALDISKNSFIDVWISPTSKGLEQGLTPDIVFKGIKIQEIKSESFNFKENTVKQEKEGESTIFIPEFLILNLTEKELKILNNINSSLYSFRISKYNESLFYKNLISSTEEIDPVDTDNKDIKETEDISIENN